MRARTDPNPASPEPAFASSGEGATALLSLDEIEARVHAFETTERGRLGLDAKPLVQWRDPNPQAFTRAQRDTTTILLGGLTIAQDRLIKAALDGLGYRIEVLDCPDTAALHLGKEFGNRGQCNPTYFTVGNLVKRLIRMRDVEKVPLQDILTRYLFFTAGACGPCRFGTYVTEYRKALRDAGFEGFRVLLFQQMGGVKQATGPDAGLELNLRFFGHVLKAVVAGDVLNAMGYRIRPYEVERGATDRALERCVQTLIGVLRTRRSVLLALRRCRAILGAVRVDRLQPKPKVSIIGEFWAMTTEGEGNYRLQRFLEGEGAEVDVQLVTAWVLYMVWQARYDTRRRMLLPREDDGRRGLAGRSPRAILVKLWWAERIVRGLFKTFAAAVGLRGYLFPSMDEIAALAAKHYDVELRGGEGHMEVGKVIHSVEHAKADMIVSVKPFGCMPSSSVSDGVQALVVSRMPQAVFCAVETTGDGAVNVQSRLQMFLFKAKRKVKAEFEATLAQHGWTPDDARSRVRHRQRDATYYPRHVAAATCANLLSELA